MFLDPELPLTFPPYPLEEDLGGGVGGVGLIFPGLRVGFAVKLESGSQKLHQTRNSTIIPL